VRSDSADRDGVVVPLRPRPQATREPRSPADDAAVYAFAGGEPGRPQSPPATDAGWEQRAADALAFVRTRLTGTYQVDEYGFDRDLTDAVALPALRALYERWFRVEVNGLDHVPSAGGALLVANHSGGLAPWDAAMAAVAVRTEHPAHRHLRLLAGEVAFRAPGFGTLARRVGATLACPADAERLLRSGELVGTWPEGYRGIGKRFRDRYQVQRFGKAGFVASAAEAGVPIVPVSIVGGEEIHPVLGHARVLARLLNLPYLPLTPTFPWLGPLGLVPLPTKWYLEFGAPISARGCDPHDPVAVGELADHVRDSIQATLYRLLGQRRSVWR
jgi:1-acyl-sn-glycerol-3-phosphate acyltransferase